jgi:hypothetical protein
MRPGGVFLQNGGMDPPALGEMPAGGMAPGAAVYFAFANKESRRAVRKRLISAV